MASYWEQLRDPRWQQKRLKIMERDGWACLECGDTGTTLNVHHSVYQRGCAPWEYDDKVLMTLCEPCHETRTELDGFLKTVAGSFRQQHLDLVLCFAFGMDFAVRTDQASVETHKLFLTHKRPNRDAYLSGRLLRTMTLKQPEYQI